MKILGTYWSYNVIVDKTRIDFVITENIQSTLSGMSSFLGKIRVKFDDYNAVNGEIQSYTGYSLKKLVLNVVLDSNDVIGTGVAMLQGLNNVSVELFEIDATLETVDVSFYNKILAGITNLSKHYNTGNVGEMTSMLKKKYSIPFVLSKSMSRFDAEFFYQALVEESNEHKIQLFLSESAFKYGKFLKERILSNRCSVCEKNFIEIIDGFPFCEMHQKERKSLGKARFDKKYKFD